MLLLALSFLYHFYYTIWDIVIQQYDNCIHVNKYLPVTTTSLFLAVSLVAAWISLKKWKWLQHNKEFEPD